jgi:hypothetical protein
MEPAEYCHQIEAYLCRKNEGHLIRIVGPAFEQVCGWAAMGVPLKVAFRGIDQYCDRYYAKGPRRRPVRIEFCEADILDLFDAWRRAIGVSAGDGHREQSAPRKPALARHLERAVSRLIAAGADGARSRTFVDQIGAVVAQLDRLAADAHGSRGEARTSILDTLRTLDDDLLRIARAEAPADLSARLDADAESELAPFKTRMPPAEFARARAAAVDRLLRDAFRLPRLTYD